MKDTTIGGWPVDLRLLVRRFRCRSADCEVVTFAEQVEGLTSRYTGEVLERVARWKRSRPR